MFCLFVKLICRCLILGVSKSFKLPNLSFAKRREITHRLPTFNWQGVKDLQPLAGGSFGYVYCANYVCSNEDSKIVVKSYQENQVKLKVVL